MYFARLTVRRSWAVSEGYVLWLLQLVTALLAGFTAMVVWINASDGDDQVGFYTLWFVTLCVFAFGQWRSFGQCAYWAKWVLFVSFLAWIGVLIWAGILIWYAVFPGIVALLGVMYWFLMAWSLPNIYEDAIPPMVADELPVKSSVRAKVTVAPPAPRAKPPPKNTSAPKESGSWMGWPSDSYGIDLRIDHGVNEEKTEEKRYEPTPTQSQSHLSPVNSTNKITSLNF